MRCTYVITSNKASRGLPVSYNSWRSKDQQQHHLKEHLYSSDSTKKPQHFPHIWTKEEDALSWTTGGERKGACQVHPKTSGAFNRCANHTIWRSVSADRLLCGKCLPWQQHCSRVMTDQVVKPQRDWSKHLHMVGWNPEINLNNAHSNNVLNLFFDHYSPVRHSKL